MSNKNIEIKQSNDDANMKHIVNPLLTWYQANKREMPWRDKDNPYYTWISEIMLQQTRVEAVRSYFIRFIDVLPTLEDLANIDDDSLMKLWEGLGYYNRARNLKKCAIACMEKYNGNLPSTYEELIELPGIGPYTAGAIASIAFGIPKAAIDGNVLRIVSRVTNDSSDILSADFKKISTSQIETIIPTENPGDFNQALMDLGATICIPNGMPRCNICPIMNHCLAYHAGTAATLPIKQPKKKRNIEHRTIVVIENDNRYLLFKRPSSGLLADMYEFANLPQKLKKEDIKKLPLFDNSQFIKITKLPASKHIFSHLEWHMQGYLVQLKSHNIVLDKNMTWATIEQIEAQYSLPTALKTYKSYVINERDSQ